VFANDYVELHCHSYYSLLDGASSPEALVERAAELGYHSLALTDHNGLYGAVRFWTAARDVGIRPLFGAEVTLDDESHLTLLVETQRGYANLCRLLSAGQLAGVKGAPRLTREIIAEYSAGLICLSGCSKGAISAALDRDNLAQALSAADRLHQTFAGRFWIELQRHLEPGDRVRVAGLVDVAHRLGIGLVATNNVHYAEQPGHRKHDVLTCIRHHTTLPDALAGGLLHMNSEYSLKSAAEMAALFDDFPIALHNSCLIAERCQAGLDFSTQRLPLFPVPQGYSPLDYLRTLCDKGLERKFDPITPRARNQLAHELRVIERTNLAGYFLVVWDIVHFARSKGIRCQGRGSAANSLVAYLLDITPVDPLRHHLLFERFLTEDAHTMPDIDVDFAADRREEVIQYVYQRYGEEHTAMVCNVVTYRARSAVREVAKALAFPPDVIDRVAKALDTHSASRAAEEITANPDGDDPPPMPAEETDPLAPVAEALDPAYPWQLLSELLSEIDGTPRHLSIHVGGMLITASPLVEVVPVERATMPGRVVVQWDKDSVEDAGLIKIDLLSLGTLAAVEEMVQLVRTGRNQELDLEHLTLDDPVIYDMLQRADAVGCFQVESRAQSQMLPRLKPRRFEDIVIEVALVRPGPIQGHMVHPYLRRRDGLEPVEYADPRLESALAETLGVIIFQEQVIRVAMAIAGFSPGEADQLRRAMSRSRSREAMNRLRDRFVVGAITNGLDATTADAVFEQLAGFAGFGFCKSHAASFALVAYQTLFLKAYYAPEFFCALLNHQPMGFYSPEVLTGDAKRHGVTILRPDLNLSNDACTLERGSHGIPALRLGLRYVHGLGEAGRKQLLERRDGTSFTGLPDLCQRTRLPRAVIENLIRSGTLDSLGTARRTLLWQLGGLDYREEEMDIEIPVTEVTLPRLSEREGVGWEYELLGLAPGDHVMRLHRQRLREQGVLSSADLEQRQDGEPVRVAGMVVVRQKPPTARGHVFVTLEDEEGLINLIIRPNVYEHYRSAVRNSLLLWAEGQLQRQGAACSVLVTRAANLTPESPVSPD
jgi:error-prone DNA polymerase